jgi:hypothetical protein
MKNMSCTLLMLSLVAASYDVARSDNRGGAPAAGPAQVPTGPAPEAAPASKQDQTFTVHTFRCPPTVKLGVRDVLVEQTWVAGPAWATGKFSNAAIEQYGSPKNGWPRCDYRFTYQGVVQPGDAIHIWKNPVGIAGMGTHCKKAGSFTFKCARHPLDDTW